MFLKIGVFNVLNVPQLTGNIQVEQKKTRKKLRKPKGWWKM